MTDRIRLLYVDDDVSSLEIRGDILGEEYGFDVTTATGVADAKRRLAAEPIDCVLSDLEMPDQDGFELLDHVRSAHGSLPFILFTGHESEEVARRAFENGATDYVPKSMINISYELLAHRIERAVEWHRHFETEHGDDRPSSDGPSPAPLSPPDALDSAVLDPDASPSDGFLWLGEMDGGWNDGTDTEDAFGWLGEDVATPFGPVAAGSAATADATDSGADRPAAEAADAIAPDDGDSAADAPDTDGSENTGPVPEDVDFSFDPPTVTGGSGDGDERAAADEPAGGATENGGPTDARDEDPLLAIVRTAVGSTAAGTPADGTTADGSTAAGTTADDGDDRSPDERGTATDPATDRSKPTGPASTAAAEPRRSSESRGSESTGDPGAVASVTEPSNPPRTVGAAGATDGVETVTEAPSPDRSTAADADTRPTTDYAEILAEIRSSSEPITVGSGAEPTVGSAPTSTDAEPESGGRGRGPTTAADRRDGSTDRRTPRGTSSSSDQSADTAPAPASAGSTTVEGGSTTDVDVGSLGSPVTDDPGSSPDGASGGVDAAGTASPPSTSTASTDTDAATRTGPTDDGSPSPTSVDGATAGTSGAVETGAADGARGSTGTASTTESTRTAADVTETGSTADVTETGSTADVTETGSTAESTETGSTTESTEAWSTVGAETEESSSVAEDDESPDSTASPPSDGAEDGGLAWEESDSYDRPDGLDLEPGTNVLVQCGSHDEREHEACVDLLGGDRIMDKHVLLVRYKRMQPSRLQRIAESAAAVKLLTVGYSQPIPDAVHDAVDTIRINNPDDLTRLGIVTTSAISDWNDAGADIHVCYHSINVPLQYKNQQSVFRFLHIFLNKLSSADAVSHFHIDPTAGGPQSVSAFKPLFDSVVSIDSVGTHLETS